MLGHCRLVKVLLILRLVISIIADLTNTQGATLAVPFLVCRGPSIILSANTVQVTGFNVPLIYMSGEYLSTKNSSTIQKISMSITQ